MMALKTQHNSSGDKFRRSPKTTTTSRQHSRLIPQPIKSWTNKPVRINGKLRENGIITSPRMLAGKGTAVPVKQYVGGEWALKECEEHTAWVNGLLKKGRQRPIGDLRKSISDGLMLVTLIEILFHTKIPRIQTRPIIRAQRLENIHLCLRFLEEKGVDIQHLSPEEITDGNLHAVLGVISAIRKRFETNYTGSSLHNGSSMNSSSIDRSDAASMTLGREGSINSQISGTSLATSRSLLNGDVKVENHSNHVNGDILPGTMADSSPEESPRIPVDTDKILSTTEIDIQGISQQHGVEMRRQTFRDHRPTNAAATYRPQPQRPPPMAWNSQNGIITNSKSPAVRDSLSMTVEERLKSLLDTPNPGGLSGGSQYLNYDEGELLELPAPKLQSYMNDDDENEAEESQLDAMLEDPDNFGDYSKDWDRYISGYVPSSKAEKKEGPRAQALLDRPAGTLPTSQGRSLLFFHAPPTQHMGPMHSTPNGDHNSRPLMGISSGSPDTNEMYSMQTPNGRLQNPAYQSPDSPSQKRLPTYQDHIQRHPTRQNQYSNRPKGHDPDSSGGGSSTPSAFRSPQNYDQSGSGESHQQIRQHLNHIHNRRPASLQHIPMENIRPNHAYSDPHHRSNHDHRTINGVPSLQRLSPESLTQNESYIDARGFQSFVPSFQSFVPSPSSSSSRSNTPELPPLSPATTPAETPPDSPILSKRQSSSFSVSSFPYSMDSSNIFDKESVQPSQGGLPKKKNKSPDPGQCTIVASKTLETKSGTRWSGGKGKRKMTMRQRASGLQSVNREALSTKKSSKSLPNTRRHADHWSDSSSNADIKPPPLKPERKQKKKWSSTIPQPPQMGDDDINGASADSIRQQLLSLEGMYNEILTVIGTNKSDNEVKKPAVIRQGSTIASQRAPTRPKSAAKTQKQREKDIKTVNKRFARVESHVVTLARSVASLSSELRSQNAVLKEIESLRHEVDSLRNTQVFDRRRDTIFSNGSRLRPFLPPHTRTQKIKKLTKFFGEEPPLLRMFLQELGYEKYAAIFEKESIGMIELPYLSEERLELLGIPIGPRLRILQEAQLMV